MSHGEWWFVEYERVCEAVSYITDKELQSNRIGRSMVCQVERFIARARRECRSTPHRFESISEEQWEAGKSRFLCNLCDLDYSDPIHID